MKIYFVLSSLLVSNAAAGISTSLPSVAIDLTGMSGDGCPFTSLSPELSWSASTSAAGCDIEAGTTSSVKPTLDVLSLPKTLWGSLKKDVAGWGVTAKSAVALDGSDCALSVSARNDDMDTSVKVNNIVGGPQIEINKGFEALDGRVSVAPKYDTTTSEVSANISYDNDNTSVQIAASADKQKLTVSQQVTDDDVITPSITSDGDISVAWDRALASGNSITTTVNVNDSVSLKWNDGPWSATLSSPVDGLSLGELDVKVNRKVSFV